MIKKSENMPRELKEIPVFIGQSNDVMDAQALIAEIVEQIQHVDGVAAVVLGGSRARGTHTPRSDIDLGIYYHPDSPLDLQALDRVAAEFDDSHRTGILTPIGGWGPWINGGGWLTVQSTPVDFLYRDLNRVADVIEACHRGQIEMVYQPGHPHGFVSSIYMAEVALCRVLWQSDERLTTLKDRTRPYPAALREALLRQFAWEVDFSLAIAQKGVERADVAYVSGCCFRAVACFLQVLFALNEQYWLNEKGAVALADSFPLRPPQLRTRIAAAFETLAATEEALAAAIRELQELARETECLVEGRR